MAEFEKPAKLSGGVFADDRGTLRFVNDFAFNGVKRFYQVENFSLSTIRAFHGHMKEAKYVYVPRGSIILCVVPLDKTEEPSRSARVERFVLSAQRPEIIYVPPRHANGFRCLEEKTSIMFFSTATMAESAKDDFRFPSDYWGAEIWSVENR